MIVLALFGREGGTCGTERFEKCNRAIEFGCTRRQSIMRVVLEDDNFVVLALGRAESGYAPEGRTDEVPQACCAPDVGPSCDP